MLNLPDQITCGRVRLRRLRPEDATAIFDSYSANPDASRYMTFPIARSVEETRAFAEWAADGWEQGKAYQFVVLSPEDAVIGGCGMERVIPDSDRHFSFGYCFTPREWNKGFATEAARWFVRWFSTATPVYRLSAVVDVENPASCRVLEKAGFQYEGVLRRYAIHPNVSSEPRDVKVYAVVK